MKTKETQYIENYLFKSCFGNHTKVAKEYGTAEVTIGFQRDGKGKERVDFLSFDAKNNIYRCYEIKVTLEDLRSSAKKSWYGNYNYLVVTKELYQKLSIEEWRLEIGVEVGLIVIDIGKGEKQTVIKSKYRDITEETTEMLNKSLLRTLFYKSGKLERKKNGENIY